MRDDFNVKTKQLLAERVGYRCSNPHCLQLTSGPHNDIQKSVNVGVAAHITAASPGGPRYDPSLSSEERRSAKNGIWLCQKCAKLIDNDSQRYTFAVLDTWKQRAEELAIREIESGVSKSHSSFDTSNILLTKRIEACQELYYEVKNASGVIRKLFETDDLIIEYKREIAFKIGLKVAELAEKTSFYLERETIVHIVGSFVGIADIFVIDDYTVQQAEIDKFNENIKNAYKMLESIKNTGKLDKTIKSSILEYYDHIRQIREKEIH